ncbi:MAG: adenylate/guanylate cyclase domain-containing protein [Betaproteobacteria bacterium]|nr:adenylate/guanylate cyclase domain-containing protein [Betaproteobacteria bacterium]
MTECAILFADVAGSTSLYEILGDERAFSLIEKCLASMSACTRDAGGRVVKTIGDAVMAVFPTADEAAGAATEMQLAAGGLGADTKAKVGLRIGFCYGPVVEQGTDVFGDAVNLASRLCDLASKGETITSRDTADRLSPIFLPTLRKLYSVPVKGKEQEVELIEVRWEGSVEEATAIARALSLVPGSSVLHLKYRDEETPMTRDRRKVTFGRDHEADISIPSRMASRAHAMIERRRDKFVLIDHSANGTYVTIEGQPEMTLRREEFPLRGHGWVAFGAPRDQSTEVVEFRCED